MQNEDDILIIEDIPNEDYLYYRVHKNDIRNSEVVPGAFAEKGEGTGKGMSTDWSRYATAAQALNRPTAKFPDGNREKTHGIVSFLVEKVRQIDGIAVIHAPRSYNLAHSHICGIPPKDPTKTEVRLKLAQIYRFEIKPLPE